jgi:hypothetical protein
MICSNCDGFTSFPVCPICHGAHFVHHGEGVCCQSDPFADSLSDLSDEATNALGAGSATNLVGPLSTKAA